MHSVSCKRAICKGDAARAFLSVSVVVLFQVWCQAIQGLYDLVELEADIWFCSPAGGNVSHVSRLSCESRVLHSRMASSLSASVLA